MSFFKNIFLLIALIFILILPGCFSDNSSSTSSTPETSDLTIPYSPTPQSGALNQPTSLMLRWACEGADYFDIHWGQGTPNLKIATGLKNKEYPRPSHALNATYFWYITAHFADGRTSIVGPTWQYTTKAAPGTNPPVGYILQSYRVETFFPAYVNILFQVLDTDGKGVTGLNLTDFTLYDDFETPAFQENNQLIAGAPNDLNIYTVIVLDNSTSLQGQITTIRVEADAFIRNILANNSTTKSTHKIALYSFSADINKLAPLTDSFTASYADLATGLAKYQLGAMSTDLYGAVVLGANEMIDVVSADSIRQSFLVLFTDGKDTQGSTLYNQAKAATNYKKVYTLGFDDGLIPGYSYDPAILQELGTAGFFDVGDGASLRIAFDEIAKDISDYSNSFYSLNYLSPREGNFLHTLRIEKTVNPIISYVHEYYNSQYFFHPEINVPTVYLVDLTTHKWYEPNSSIPLANRRFLTATYLGSFYPTVFNKTPANRFVDDPKDPTNSKFYLDPTGGAFTLTVTDSLNKVTNKFTFL